MERPATSELSVGEAKSMDPDQVNEKLRKELLIKSYDQYYAHKVPGLYISTELSAHIGHVVVKAKRHGGSELTAVWDSEDRPRGVSDKVVDMLGRPGTRVPGVLNANEEVGQPLQIQYKPEIGTGTTINIPFGEQDKNAQKSGRTAERLHPHPEQVQTGDPDDDAELSELDDDPREELTATKDVKGKKQQEGAVDQSDDSMIYLCTRRHGTRSYYLILDEQCVYHKRFESAEVSIGFDAGDYEHMHSEAPKQPYQAFKLSPQSRVEISRFPKGYTVRSIGCNLKSGKKPLDLPPNSKERTLVDDTSFYALCPESPRFTHSDYQTKPRNANDERGSEGKIYPVWHHGIAVHNQGAWDEFVRRLSHMVRIAGGSVVVHTLDEDQ